MRGTLKTRTSLLILTPWQEAIKTFDPTEANFIPIRERRAAQNRRSRIPYLREEIEEEEVSGYKTDAQRIQAPQAEIMFGGVGDAIDDLSNMDRLIYEAPEFIVVGGYNPSLFHMRDEEGSLRATIKKRNKKGQLVPVAFEDPNAGGMDLETVGVFDPETDLVDMINKYSEAKWSDLKRDQRINEHQENAWQTHAPALLLYLTDILPDYPMEAASPVLIEPGGQIAQIHVPEYESRVVVLLHGLANMYIVDEDNIERDLLEDASEIIEVDGPCHIILENDEENDEDTLLVIGKPMVEDGRVSSLEDIHMRAMASPIGYKDSSQVSQPLEPILDDCTDKNDEEELLPDDVLENGEVGMRVFQGRLGVLPDINTLGDNIPDDLNEQCKLYYRETAGTISMEQWRVSKKLKRLDDDLTLRLDSVYLGRGYVPPMLRWEKILEDEPSLSAEAADRRAEGAEALYKTAQRIDTLQKMQAFRERIFPLNQADKALVNAWSARPQRNNNPSVLDVAIQNFTNLLKNERVQRLRCNICGCIINHSPRYATYLAAYLQATGQEEKSDLPRQEPKCWSKHAPEAEALLKRDKFTVISDYPITAVQSAYKTDKKTGAPLVENILRKKIWHWFERRREVIPAQIKWRLRCNVCNTLHDRTCSKTERNQAQCPKCNTKGRLSTVKFLQVTKAEFRDDSRWWKDRTEAFKHLTATQAQWNRIYKQLWIQQDRMQQCFMMQDAKGPKVPLHERKAQWKQQRDLVWKALKTAFKGCITTYDLDNFEQAMTQQTIAKSLSQEEKDKLKSQGKRIYQPGSIIQRSPFDRITFGDEMKIRIAIAKRRAKIEADQKAAGIIKTRRAKTFIPSANCANADKCDNEYCLGKETIEGWCYKCNTPAENAPRLGITEEDGSGYIYIPCSTDDCDGIIAVGAYDGPRKRMCICTKNRG